MNFETALRLTEIITALSCLFQALEIIFLKKAFQITGVWRTADLLFDYENNPLVVKNLLRTLFSPSVFLGFQYISVVSSAGLLIAPHVFWSAFLFLNILIVAARFRGSFNGGSDYMTVLVLLVLILSQAAGGDSKIALGAFWYLSLQTILSYFISGVVKLKNPEWRNGRALSDVLLRSNYDIPAVLKKRALNTRGMMMAGLFVLAFELSFPLVLLGGPFVFIYLSAAFLFHLFNAWALGLNRFTWAWLAAYPALVYCVH